MTTTDIALVESNEIEPLSKAQAKALDKKIRAASDKVSTSTEALLELLEQAALGQIHVALEYASWPAWFKDSVQVTVSDRFERKELVKLMSGKGMSQRAIAGSLGVSQKTVDRDLEGEEFESATVTSLDGVERPRNGQVKDDVEDTLDVEFEEVAPMTAVDIVTSFADETANLFAAQNELSLLAAEDKWSNARKRVAAASLNDVQNVIAALQAVVDDLMEEGS